MQRNAGQRTVAIALALLVQCVLVAPYILHESGAAAAPDPDVARLVFIQSIETSGPASTLRKTGRVAESTAPLTTPAISIVPETARAADTQFPPVAIDVTPVAGPTTDWYFSMQDAARDVVRRDAEQEKRANLLDSEPDGLKLPPNSCAEPAFTAERQANGDTITRHRKSDQVTVICEYRQLLLSELFDVHAYPRARLCSQKETGSQFSALDLEDVRPGYLRRPLPKPAPAKASD